MTNPFIHSLVSQGSLSNVKHLGKSLLGMFSVKASGQLSNCRLHKWQSGPMCLFIGKQDKADARNRSLFYGLQSSLLSTAMLYVTVGQCSLFQRSPELELEKERCSGSSELWEIPKQLLPRYLLPFYWFCSHMGLQEFHPELCGYLDSIHSVENSSPHVLLLFW